MAKQSTEHYLKLAKKHGLVVYPGSKHWKIEGNDPVTHQRSVMMVPHELHGTGTEYAIRKWLLRMGVLLAIVLAWVIF